MPVAVPIAVKYLGPEVPKYVDVADAGDYYKTRVYTDGSLEPVQTLHDGPIRITRYRVKASILVLVHSGDGILIEVFGPKEVYDDISSFAREVPNIVKSLGLA